MPAFISADFSKSESLMRLSADRIRHSHSKVQHAVGSCLPDRVTSRSSQVDRRLALISALIHSCLWSCAICYKRAGGGCGSKGQPLRLQHLLLSRTVLQLIALPSLNLLNVQNFPPHRLTDLPGGRGHWSVESTYRKCNTVQNISHNAECNSIMYLKQQQRQSHRTSW